MIDPEGAPRRATLRDYVEIIWADRRKVTFMTTIGVIVFLILGFLLPPLYQATTTVVPATSTDRTSTLGNLGIDLSEFGIHGAARGGSPLIYPDIVRSRRLLDQVLQMSFSGSQPGRSVRLIDVIQPGQDSPKRTERAIKRMLRLVSASVDRRTGVLTIRVRAPRPELASGVANSLDTLLQQFMIESFTSQAGKNRVFIEGRLNEVRVRVAQQEELLKSFRERNLRVGNSPRLLLEEGRLARALREQEEVYLTLNRQHELARIEEHRDVPVLNVLDAAVPPAFRYSPRRSILVTFGAVLGFLVGSGLAVWRRL